MIELVELRHPAIQTAATRPLHSLRDAHLEPRRSLPSYVRIGEDAAPDPGGDPQIDSALRFPREAGRLDDVLEIHLA